MATYGSYKKIASESIVDTNVTNAKFVNNTISTAKLATNSVGTTELAATTVGTTNIGTGEVGTNQLDTTLDLSGRTVTYRSIVNADISASAAIATSKLTGALTSITSNGLATSATTNTLNATNITSGTLTFARGSAQSSLTNGFSVHPNARGNGAGVIAWATGNQGHQTGASSNTWQFDANSQIVTVYQTGTYLCMVEVITATSSGPQNMYIRVNDGNWTDFRGGDTIGNHAATSGAISMNLSANDNVRIYMDRAAGWHENYYSRWSFTKLGGWS
jgi:hypothetical protein